jgi:hypothetical protein
MIDLGNYTEDWFDYYKEGPILILGTEIPTNLSKYEPPKYSKNYEWKLIKQQSAGFMCHHRYFWATELPVTDKAKVGMYEICNRYVDSLIGEFKSLDTLEDYRKTLKHKLNVDCNNSYLDLEESVYPVDLEEVRKLTTSSLPSDLNKLYFEDEKEPANLNYFGLIRLERESPFKLIILGENCD